MTKTKNEWLADLERDKQERKALLARLEEAAVPGSEWTNEAQRLYLVVTRAMGDAGALCLRRFDARGFSGHATRACAAAAAQEIVDWLGMGAQPAPGALERLAPTFDVTAPQIVLTRPDGTAPWSWHEKRLFGQAQDAYAVCCSARSAGQEAQVLQLPSGPWAEARLEAQTLLARCNVADLASRISAASRYCGPNLTTGSTRDELVGWLVWNDPNGCYTDDASALEDMPPLSLASAWEAVASAVAGETHAA